MSGEKKIISTKTTPEDVNTTSQKPKQSRLSQGACPSHTIEEALVIPKAIKDNYAGQAVAPLLVAEACGISPTSSNWRTLTGAAVAYGLTNGGYNSKEIAIAPLGESIVSPLKEGEEIIALKESVLKPTILGDFYKQYDRNKLPRIDIAQNVLRKKGIPAEKIDSAWSILMANATKANILKVIGGNEYLFLDISDDLTVKDSKNEEVDNVQSVSAVDIYENIPTEILQKINVTPPDSSPSSDTVISQKEKPHIFISHGKNNAIIVGQLKELLIYGQMEPIISVDRETTAIPVPDKVFDDMRNCDAGIIHIDLEEVSLEDGKKYNRLNENVLIEIGAAIALYGKRVILLCKKGTSLPSNLQGLYRCEYEGNQLDYTATMKLLKTMQELRSMM